MRTNLATDPSLRSGTTDAYVAVGGAQLSITEDHSFYGEHGLLVSKAGVNGSGVRIAKPVPVLGGKPYAFSIYGRLPITIPLAEHADVVLQVDWLNSLGTITATNTSAILSMDSDDTWYRIGGVWTAPGDATFVLVSVLQPLAGSANAKIVLDALVIEQANYIGGYFDNLTQAEKNRVINKSLSNVPQVLNGVRLGADIVLNGLVLNTIDEDDTVWIATDLDGWWGQAAPELPNIQRGTEDGSYDVEGRTQAREVTLSGFFIPKDPEQSLTKAVNRLVEACNLVRTGGWLHTHEYPTKGAFVRLAAKPTVRTVNARGKTEFSVTLRAGDPIKYHWDDADPDGYTNLRFQASDVVGYADNIGTATVTGNFTLTGPAGAGTTVFNATTNETMTLQYPLRGAGVVAEASYAEALNGMATIRTTAPHNLRVGDEVSLLNMVIPFSEATTARKITAVSDVFPYSFSFKLATDNINLLAVTGQVVLLKNDVLEIDTYNRAVTFNGEKSGHRDKLTTLTDWIKFGPGENIIQFYDNVTKVEVINKQLTSNVVTLTTDDVHYLIPGEQIRVDLPVDKGLAKKSLSGNVVTLTTDTPHGFSVGDSVDVKSSELSKIITKSRTSNVVTLTTEAPHGIAQGDTVTVALPTSAVPNRKQLTSNQATLTTQYPHGLSAGDSVTVALPATASITSKGLTNNQATLSTSAAHNFSVGDVVTVTMPGSATVSRKTRSGTAAILTTSVEHGFSVGDTVIVSLPTSATLAGNIIADGNTNLATFTTSTAHNFSVGDQLELFVPGAVTSSVSQRSATSTQATLVIGNHSWSVGEKIRVTGVNSRYDGTYYISSVTATSITYDAPGGAGSETTTTGTVTNETLGFMYNGVVRVETIPSTTTFTIRVWEQQASTFRPANGASVTNTTNSAYNGTKTISAVTPTTFTYNY